MRADELLNPPVDSLEACHLVLSAFFVTVYFDEESNIDDIAEAVEHVGLLRLMRSWEHVTGNQYTESLKSQYENIVKLTSTLSNELGDMEDPYLFLEQFSNNIQQKEIQELLLSFIKVLSSVGRDKPSDGQLEFLFRYTVAWNIEDLDIYEISENYKFSDMLDYEIISEGEMDPKSIDNKDFSKKDEKGCFVATAVLNENHYLLYPLRNFRDRFLLKNYLGELFVNWYYRNGPTIATIISKIKILKFLVRFLLIIPFAKLINNFKIFSE